MQKEATILLESPQEKREPAGEQANILLVDDHIENLLALEAALSNLGQRLVRAQSGREALKYLLQDDFAVILLDVQMPEMSGYETAALIRSREKNQHTPILFLTAINKSDAHISLGYSVGAIDYVFKPFEPEILRAKVAAFVELARKQRELEAEIGRRKEAEEQVRRLNTGLEKRIAERTAALQAANTELQSEIAERKRAEAVLAEKQRHIEDLNARLQRAMTETHHRVKNNLQLIAAMLDMNLIENPVSLSVEEIMRLRSYIRTLAAVHDILTQQAKADGEAHTLSAKEVLNTLLNMLQEASHEHTLAFTLADVQLTARQGTSLALVTNELVNNGLKHGKGRVDVALRKEPEAAVLEVRDDGPGFPPSFTPAQFANTGLELIEHLVKWDLEGSIAFANASDGGAIVQVRIPLKK
jgi:two-component sensor histidine kinase